MASRIPLEPSIANYRIGSTINDRQYLFDIRWNTREACWYMDVLEDDETPIVHGIKLVLGVILGRRTVDPDFPPGAFIMSDLTGQDTEATFDDLGVRVCLYYYTPEELAALG